ncbi:MAG: hypothetical protein DMG86_10940, partial [Acidobacteria bacterium]
MDNKPNFSREVKLQWAGSLEKEISPGRGGAFFLTSLFIEPIDHEGGPMPQISTQEFERLPLRVHAFLAGVPL